MCSCIRIKELLFCNYTRCGDINLEFVYKSSIAIVPMVFTRLSSIKKECRVEFCIYEKHAKRWNIPLWRHPLLLNKYFTCDRTFRTEFHLNTFVKISSNLCATFCYPLLPNDTPSNLLLALHHNFVSVNSKTVLLIYTEITKLLITDRLHEREKVIQSYFKILSLLNYLKALRTTVRFPSREGCSDHVNRDSPAKTFAVYWHSVHWNTTETIWYNASSPSASQPDSVSRLNKAYARYKCNNAWLAPSG